MVQLAQAVLVQGGIAPARLEMQVREGVPAEELVKVASRSAGSLHRAGISRRGAPAPPVPPPAGKHHRAGLCAGLPARSCWCRGPRVPPTWSPGMQRRSSASCANAPLVCPSSPQRRWLPALLLWHRTHPRRKEVTAATKALQQLSDKGVLICQQVKGNLAVFQ